MQKGLTVKTKLGDTAASVAEHTYMPYDENGRLAPTVIDV